MKREDSVPAVTPLPDISCPKCEKSGGYSKHSGDLGVLYRCSHCGFGHFLSWTSLEDLKGKAL